MNLYDILGVPRTATSDEIKKAYRKLAMQFHPDRNPGDSEAANKFKQTQEAYDILSDPNNRARYDGSAQQGKPKQQSKSTEKGKRPYAGDGFTYRDAPPPKYDLWGEVIRPEEKWVDAYSDKYEDEFISDVADLIARQNARRRK